MATAPSPLLKDRQAQIRKLSVALGEASDLSYHQRNAADHRLY
jgi:hypothetical protein